MKFKTKEILRFANQIGLSLRAHYSSIRRFKTKQKPIRIAIDGGAFQQGAAAGIYNVAVGLINSIAKQRPETHFTLITDPKFGGCNEELLGGLSIRPDLMELSLEESESKNFSNYYTDDPGIIFEVDGIPYPPIVEGGDYIYRGPKPLQSLYILSRADRPKFTGAGTDPRKLGVSLARIEIRNRSTYTILSLDDCRLAGGYYPPEGSWRWTDGRASLPIALFSSDEVEIFVRIAGTTRYRLRDGELQISGTQSICSIEPGVRNELEYFEDILLRRGIQFYLVNHFMPLRLKKIRTLAINYDAIPILFPQYFTSDAIDNFESNMKSFKHASHVFSISEASRNDLLRIISKNPTEVTTMSIDIDPGFVRSCPSDVFRVRLKYSLGSAPYIICVGTLEPRKNHRLLLEAYSAIARTGTRQCDLVIVGKEGWGIGDLKSFVASNSFSEHVHFLNDVPNVDLPALYSGAMFSIYPSMYEGFGLPILEAMACGCPVVTSTVSSMPEVAGDAACYIDPGSIDSITSALRQMIADNDLRNALARKGIARRNAFSWDLTAAHFLHVLDHI